MRKKKQSQAATESERRRGFKIGFGIGCGVVALLLTPIACISCVYLFRGGLSRPQTERSNGEAARQIGPKDRMNGRIYAASVGGVSVPIRVKYVKPEYPSAAEGTGFAADGCS